MSRLIRLSLIFLLLHRFGARVRSGFFLIYYFYVAAFLFGYRFSVKRNEDTIKSSTEDWVRCYYVTGGVGCPRTPPNRPSPARNYVELASLNGLMLVALLMYRYACAFFITFSDDFPPLICFNIWTHVSARAYARTFKCSHN